MSAAPSSELPFQQNTCLQLRGRLAEQELKNAKEQARAFDKFKLVSTSVSCATNSRSSFRRKKKDKSETKVRQLFSQTSVGSTFFLLPDILKKSAGNGDKIFQAMRWFWVTLAQTNKKLPRLIQNFQMTRSCCGHGRTHEAWLDWTRIVAIRSRQQYNQNVSAAARGAKKCYRR